MELLVFWLLLSAAIGAAAASKGRSGIGFFLLSLILSPLIGGFIALIVPRIGPTPVQLVNPPPADPAGQIAQLASLRDSGAITDEEFQAKKTDLLARV